MNQTVTLSQVRDAELPTPCTGIRWDDGWTECFDCITDGSYRSVLGGAEYDPADVAEVLTGHVDCDLHSTEA